MLWSADLTRAKAFYRLLGFSLVVDAPGNHYVRMQAPRGDATLSLHGFPEGATPTPTHTTLYLEAESPEALATEVARLRMLGITFEMDPTDQPWGWREAHLKDPDGTPLVLYFAGHMRLDPPWKVAG
jgi:catechol 2,3-dioxygenase-like lactoylglutathione lyase family enzyme